MTMEHAHQLFQETDFERESRDAASFNAVEIKLPQRWSGAELAFVDKIGSAYHYLRGANPKLS